jgi:hypothetical protein
MIYESNSASSNPFHCTAPSPKLCWINCDFLVLIPVHLQVEHVTVSSSSIIAFFSLDSVGNESSDIW